MGLESVSPALDTHVPAELDSPPSGSSRAPAASAVISFLAPSQAVACTTIDLEYDMGERDGTELPCDDAITGTVVHEDGTPAARALVYLGGNRRRANERGEFRICVPGWSTPNEIWAFERGRLPARADVPAFVHSALQDLVPRCDGPAKRPSMRLQLGGPTLSIRARLVDADHRPLAGWCIGLKNSWTLSTDGPPWTCAEALARPAPGHLTVTTDAAGVFEYDGLLEEPYSFLVYDPVSFRSGETSPVPAGSRDMEVVVPLRDNVPTLRGRVLGLEGTPIAKAAVSLQLWVFASRTCAWIWKRDPVETTADGAFELHDVPPVGAELWVEGDGLVRRPFSNSELDLQSVIRLNVQRLCAVHVEGLPVGAQPLQLHALTAWGTGTDSFWLDSHGGRQRLDTVLPSEANVDLLVPESVSKLRLFGGTCARVDERTVQPKPGEPTTLRW